MLQVIFVLIAGQYCLVNCRVNTTRWLIIVHTIWKIQIKKC